MTDQPLPTRAARLLGPDDHEAAWTLGSEAFGGPVGATVPPAPATGGRHAWGVDDADRPGRLAAKLVALDLSSWFRGAEVATSGIAGVAVAAEHRGRGLLAPLLTTALDDARDRGAVVSTLYPTATGIYRSCGYEVVASYDTVEVAVADLRGVAPAPGVTTRRAQVDDVPAVRALYERWARAQNGPLTRTGPRFAAPDTDLLDGVSAVTLALSPAGDVVGCCSWTRGEGYDPATAVLTVHDLLALHPDGYRALWRVLGSFGSVVGRVRLSTSGLDPARLVLPTSSWDVVGRHPYMLRVLDVAAALAGPGGAWLPAAVAAVLTEPLVVDLAVTGDRLGRLDGCYRLALGAGPTRCEPVDTAPSGVPTFTPQGLALAYAGAQSCENLRQLGHLTGPAEHDDLLDVVLTGPPLHVRDYF